ncbi:uncharacterized protein METZ01_LOCUS449714 [marine metagenome]|uniref:SGNH/GDSL hydrolase family protein n=1 Tax=marine metagenome TaxID=408172 RepID=A0A382ZNJ7_9ZZZZ
MRLVAFGCSNTYGQALPDVWDQEKNEDTFNQKTLVHNGPSKYAWPEILANKLNIECVNNGFSGASNKEIWYNILCTTFYKDDIVIILWPYFERYCFIQKNKIKQLGTWMTTDPTYPNYEQSKAFFKYFYDEYDMLLDFYLRVNHIQTFLQDKVELIKHSMVKRPQINFRELGFVSHLFHWNKIKHNLYMSDFIEQYLPKALDNGHPGTNAHKAFATAIYDEIKDEIT